MFSRFVRPYRRARKYAKKRVYGRKGISFAAVKSKAWKSMDPPSKRRKAQFISSENLWSNSEEKAGGVERQGLGPVESALSMVRFKEPSAVMFEYHHMVRRIRLDPWIISGVAGTEQTYGLDTALATIITDIATISNLYERIRVTRVRCDFIPQIVNNTADVPNTSIHVFPEVLTYTYKNAQMAVGLPANYSAAVDDLQAAVVKGNQAFAIDTIPFILNNETITVNSGSSTLTSEMEAPWVRSTTDPRLFIGSAFSRVVAGSAFQMSQIYTIMLTTWFDVDTMV